DGPMVEPWPEHRPRVEVVDLSEVADPPAAAHQLMRLDYERAIDPASDPMARGILIRLAPDRHWWYQRIHHLVIDGYGTILINDRIVELYNAAVEGGQTGMPLDGYAAALEADRAYLDSPRMATDREFWLESDDDGASLPALAAVVTSTGIP